ncbi:MAG: hypothetical protein U0414_30040 [Polyangiaceae bacterium]
MMMRTSYENSVGRIQSMISAGGRSGWVVPIIDKNEFVFGSAGTVDINLAQSVDSSQWVTAVLVTRIFITPTFTGTLNVYTCNSFLAEDDPATLFGPAVPTTTYVHKSANITNATAAATLDVVAATGPAPIGPQLRVFLECTTTGAGKVTLGVTLVGRPA